MEHELDERDSAVTSSLFARFRQGRAPQIVTAVYDDVPWLSDLRAAIFESDRFCQEHVDVFDRLLQEAGYSLDDVPYPEPPDDPNVGIPWPF